MEWPRTEVLLPTQAGTRHQERAQSSNGKIATVVLIGSPMISELDASVTPRSGRDGSASQIAAQIAAVSNNAGLNSVARETEIHRDRQ